MSTNRAARAVPDSYPGRLASAGYAVLLAASVVLSVGWLAIGATIAVATYSPTVAGRLTALATEGNRWATGVLAAVFDSEPFGQAVLDYSFSVLHLVVAGLLLFLGMRTWVTQLLAIAMIGSAAAFNLQAHAAAVAIETAIGADLGGLHQVIPHGVAAAVYVAALLMLPSGRWEFEPRGGLGQALLLAACVATLLGVGLGSTLLPHTDSCILLFGFAVPLIGLVMLPRQMRFGPSAEIRTQARLLFSVLLSALGTSAALALLTLLLWYLNEPGLMLVDPTAHESLAGPSEQPTALLFWFSRLSAAGIAVAVLLAIRRGRLWQAERVFSRGLASLTVVILVGGGYAVIRAAIGWFPYTDSDSGAFAAATLATALAALVFLPVYLRAEHLVDQLLYGQRPTPYRVLAEITALSQRVSTQGPDLAGVAEAIGRGLGARSCRLTVRRPGLRDRTYAWSAAPSGQNDEEVVLPIRQGSERIGAIAVDRGAVAGLHNERRTLLEDVADSLGAILQASRLGIELERQLRAALAHAEEIAVSRRQAVAEMDSERRMIERDLHDGAQHHLVSLRLALGLVEHEVGSGEFEQARERLDQLAEQITTAETVLAKTATGVSSIVLAESGLAAALTADLAGALPPIEVHIAEEVARSRFGAEVEEAVYFCCLESVNNARKHAAGAPITLRLEVADGRLWFSIQDKGPGFDPAANTGSPGRGIRNVGTRILQVGGQITVDSVPGAGTTVHGSVPLPSDTEQAPALSSVAPVTTPATEPALAPGPANGQAPVEPMAVSSPPSPVAAPTSPLKHAAPTATLTNGPRASITSPLPEEPPPGHTSVPAPREPAQASAPVSTTTPASSSATPPAPPRESPTAPSAPPAPESPSARVATQRYALSSSITDQLPTAPVSPSAGEDLSELPLRDQALALLDTARSVYPDGAERERLEELSEWLNQPLRVAVVGPSGSGVSTFLRALRATPGPPDLELLTEADLAGREAPTAEESTDVVLLLIRKTGEEHPRYPPAPVIGVLTRADECGGSGPDALELAQRLADEYRNDPELRESCQTVVPVAALLALTGATLTEQDVAALRELAERPGQQLDSLAPPQLAGRLGRFGLRTAVELLRKNTAATREDLTEELVRLSGLPQLRQLLMWRFARHADALKVRALLRELELLVQGSSRIETGREQLLYRLEQLRSGAHELVEIDLADALRAGTPPLSEADRRVAERLLGRDGAAPAARLGLGDNATVEAIVEAASRQLTHWQRLAAHPASTSTVRDAAEVLARTCEKLLARPGG